MPGVVDLDATLEEIKRHDADLIFLQEVERAQPGGVQIQPPPNFTRLSAGLKGYHKTFAYPKADVRELPFGVGLAIFSKTPLKNETRVELPSPPIEFKFESIATTPTDRLLIGARTTISGREVQLFNTHLLAFFMLGTSSREHPKQREMVANAIASTAIGPTLLAGDFNVRGHTSLIAQFARRGYLTVQSEEITWRRQPYILDHIFYNPYLRTRRHEVVPTPTSDHHLLVADFDFA